MDEKKGASNKVRFSLSLLIACAVGIYFWGIRDRSETTDAVECLSPINEVTAMTPVDAPPAVRDYTELRTSPLYSQIQSWIADQERLRKNTPRYTDEVNVAGTDKETALLKRAQNRAFDGAPPTVPHPIMQTGRPDCLVCHRTGLKIHGRTASAVSHHEMQNCTQCHTSCKRQAPDSGRTWPEENIPWKNGFAGKISKASGPRAFAIGPPQIPHPTFMREKCDSCHGLNGNLSMRSTHPNRLNCEQCHVGAASDDQRVTLFLPAVDR